MNTVDRMGASLAKALNASSKGDVAERDRHVAEGLALAQPDFYQRAAFLIDEIKMGRNVVLAKTRKFDTEIAALVGSFHDRMADALLQQAVLVETTADEIATIARQMKELAATVSRQVANHKAREVDNFEAATEVYGERT